MAGSNDSIPGDSAPSPDTRSPIVAWATRGDRVESVHRASWVLVQGDRVLESAGDPGALVYPRSSLKPLQLLPLFSWEGFDGLGLSAAERAILVASHSSDEEHVAAVRGVLARAGAGVPELACGPHDPMDREAAIRLRKRGEDPSAIHNNCSGKHAGFLLSARRLGAPLAGYLDVAHPVQLEIAALLEELTGVGAGGVESPGVDGCGAPNWPLPIVAMAELFRDLANPERLPARYRGGAERIFDAVQREPHYLAGRGRFDSALTRAGGGEILGKCGAEGYFAIGVRAGPGRPATGIAIKVHDGAKRAYECALPGFLRRLGLIERTDPEFEAFGQGLLRNTQGRPVGRLIGRWDPARGGPTSSTRSLDA